MWRGFILFLISIFFPILLFADINKIKLSDGSVLFTNHPKPSHEIINLLNPTVSSKKDETTKESKRQLIILYPKDGETFHNIRQLKVNYQNAPALKKNERIQLIFDNIALSKTDKPFFLITQPERGSHELELKWLDENGNVLISSKKVIIYVHQAFIK